MERSPEGTGRDGHRILRCVPLFWGLPPAVLGRSRQDRLAEAYRICPSRIFQSDPPVIPTISGTALPQQEWDRNREEHW